MSSKTEEFPTLVSPTRMMVYNAFALSFDVLMVPFLSDSTSRANTVRAIALKMAMCYLIVGVISSSSSSKTFSRRSAEL